jgi:cytochrome c biogenesis protein CcdA
MRGHRFDPLSFVFGLLFLSVTAMAATGSFDLNASTLTWIGAGVLLFIGVLMLATGPGKVRRETLDETDDEE